MWAGHFNYVSTFNLSGTSNQATSPTCSSMQVIQYIDLIKTGSNPEPTVVSTAADGGYVYVYSSGGFQGDVVEGHGTHVAGSAAGATLNSPVETVVCDGTKVPGCVGGCINGATSTWGDDLLTMSYNGGPYDADVDRICPMLGCDDATETWCLNDDVEQTLTEHGGVAQGAKLAFFDVVALKGTQEEWLVRHPGNGLWEPCLEAGCKVHSNSWGEDSNPDCILEALDVGYDDFMYKVSHGPNTLMPDHCYIRDPVQLCVPRSIIQKWR